MPFGRFRGRAARRLPSRYIAGLLRDDSRLGTALRCTLATEAQRRRILAPVPRVTAACLLAEIARRAAETAA